MGGGIIHIYVYMYVIYLPPLQYLLNILQHFLFQQGLLMFYLQKCFKTAIIALCIAENLKSFYSSN